MNQIEIDRLWREETRWRILVALNAGRPQAVSETLVLRVLGDLQLSATPHALRRELDYLENRQLIEINRGGSVWLAELTRLGVDVVEYTLPCDPGIARPPADQA